MRDRHLLIPAALLVAAKYGWDWLWHLWVEVLAPGTHEIYFEWFDQHMLQLWGLLFALSLIMAFLAIALTRPTKPVTVGLVLGLLLGLLLLRVMHFGFTPQPPTWIYVWRFGFFLMAPLGAFVGSLVAVKGFYGRQAAV